MSADQQPPARDDLLEQAYSEFCEAWLEGKQTDPEEFCRRHPSCGSELEVLLNEFIANSNCLKQCRRKERTSFPLQIAEEESFEEKTLGDYRLIREIGRGGMGVVYKARQITLDREIAIKALPALLTLRPETVARFKREAATAAKLKHPGIVRIIAIAEEEGNHFFAMELIKGAPLNEVLEKLAFEEAVPRDGNRIGAAVRKAMILDRMVEGEDEPGSEKGELSDFWKKTYIEVVCRLCIQVAEALEYAHAAGVIHRDIKPSNILVREDGSCVLTDFGLARMEGLPSLTVTGELAGTPHYIAPEQASPKAKNLNHRVDIYSLGVTLYEMLTLIRPFEGRTSHEILSKIASKEPTTPRHTNPLIPKDLETICLTAMNKDPARRYASAAALQNDLENFLGYRPITARPAGLTTRTYRLVRRNPALSAIFVLLFLLVVVGPTVFGIQQKLFNIEVQGALTKAEKERKSKEEALIEVQKAFNKAEEERQAKEEALRRVEAELAVSNSVTSYLEKLFQKSAPGLAHGKNITAYELLQQGAATINADFKDQPETRVRLGSIMGIAFIGWGDYQRGEKLLKDALSSCQEALGEGHKSSIPILYHLGEIYIIMDRYEEAESAIERVLAATSRLSEDEEIHWHLSAMNSLGSLRREEGNLEEAEKLFHDSWKMSEKTLGKMDRLTIQSMMYLGYIYNQINRVEEAEPLLLDCLDRCLEECGEGDYHTEFTLNALGTLYLKKGNWEKAESHLLRVTEISRSVYGPEALNTHLANVNLAALYTNLKRYEEAEPLLIEAVKCLRDKMGETNSGTLESIANLTYLFLMTDRPDEAAHLAGSTLEKTPEDMPEIAHNRNVLNQLLREAKRKQANKDRDNFSNR